MTAATGPEVGRSSECRTGKEERVIAQPGLASWAVVLQMPRERLVPRPSLEKSSLLGAVPKAGAHRACPLCPGTGSRPRSCLLVPHFTLPPSFRPLRASSVSEK